jgi:alpha-glucosidase
MVRTPMEHIPVFARGGAVIPMWPEAPDSTDGYHPAVIELHLFVPTVDGEHRSLLQEDDGLTFAADRGQRCRTELTVTRAGHRLELRADVDGDGYPEFAREAFRLVVHGAQPASVRLDGEDVPAVEDAFLLPNAGEAMVVDFEI